MNIILSMAKALTPTARITKARQFIQQAREIPAPDSAGWEYFSYTAQVKDTLKKAFELVKLIQYSPGTPPEVKAEARALIESLLSVEKEILKGGSADAPS
ncbi:MAG TPA: hypothetical protein PLV20_05960 [Anaerolineaceae bacterium]|nr:hypothetical protein [Anaerolineaceae bacterium]